MNNLDLIRQYVSTGNQIPEHQANRLNPNLLKTYTRAILNMFKVNYDAGFVEEPIEDYNFDLFNDEQKLFYFKLLSDGKLDLNRGNLHQLIQMPDKLKGEYYANSYAKNDYEDYRYNLEKTYFNLDKNKQAEWLEENFNSFLYYGYYKFPDIIWNDISDEWKLKFFNTTRDNHLNMEKFYMLSDDMKMKYAEILVKKHYQNHLLPYEYRYAAEDIKIISDKREAEDVYAYVKTGLDRDGSHLKKINNKRKKMFYAELVVSDKNKYLDNKDLFDNASEETKFKHYQNMLNKLKAHNDEERMKYIIDYNTRAGLYNQEEYERLKSIYGAQLAELRNVVINQIKKIL